MIHPQCAEIITATLLATKTFTLRNIALKSQAEKKFSSESLFSQGNSQGLTLKNSTLNCELFLDSDVFFSPCQPSNSGRAAELLAKEQGTVPGFIGFGTFQSDLGYVPAVQGAEEIDNLVDSDFRMVLRKLSKKDVTTKLKVRVLVSRKMMKIILLLRYHWHVSCKERGIIASNFFHSCTFF